VVINRWISLLCGWLTAGSCWGVEPWPAGTNVLAVTLGQTPIRVFTYRPAEYRDGPLIVVFHGMNRNADTYRDNARGLGDRFGALIAAPEFDGKRFPSEAYQRAGITRKGKAQPQEAWTATMVAQLLEALRERTGRPDLPCHLIGHSAGGQFLTRVAGFADTGAVRLVAANPGTHLFPTRELPFPYGFGGLPEQLSGDAALKRYLARPLTLYLGTADVGKENLDQSATAMKQGATRIERGRNCFAAAQALARERGWPCHWKLVEAPGVGHSSKAMFDHARCAGALLGEKASGGKVP
jgi:pimeloyl-ACP methyl ester carboxylesterase